MTDYKKVFIVGCPRSGTTWVQLLVEQHPKIASGPETQVFEWYLEPLLRAWETNGRTRPSTGLYRLMSAEEFDNLLRNLVADSLEKFTAYKPDAEVILEKTPWHLKHHETMLRLFPDALILHVIRDPRSVAASLKAAKQHGWGRSWSPGNAHDAARLWRRAMDLRSAVAAATPHYREVLYEDLVANTSTVLANLFEWIGLEASPQFCAQAVEACRIEKLRNKQTTGLAEQIGRGEGNLEHFYRQGKASGWRQELTRGEVKTIEFIAGKTMRELHYAPDFEPTSKPLPLRFTDLKRNFRHRLAPFASAISTRLSK